MLKIIVAALLFVLLPMVSQACTVCFGGSDSDLARGFYWGIIILGALPYILLTGFISVIVYSLRKNQSKRLKTEVPS